VAVIGFIGHYVTSNFHITSAANGTVAIFDPPVIAQRSTLGFSDAPGGTAKIVGTVVGDTAAGKFALLGNYIASEFASVTNGHAGILPTEPQHTEQQPLLTHLHGRWAPVTIQNDQMALEGERLFDAHRTDDGLRQLWI
jgi:hypothetical protein